jgi:hypothetical protein
MQQKNRMPSTKLIYFQIPTLNPAQQLPTDCSKCKGNILVRFAVFRVQAVAPTQGQVGGRGLGEITCSLGKQPRQKNDR